MDKKAMKVRTEKILRIIVGDGFDVVKAELADTDLTISASGDQVKLTLEEFECIVEALEKVET